MTDNPKVFISHASEDKEKFVRPFAIALRASGIDAWVDEWEILPGDSLVQKIFEEGIGGASAIIVVLSKISVSKKWVREELDAAVISRINKATRLIPIIIEDCDVPVALSSAKWVRANSENFHAAVDEIVRAIFSHVSKPTLGEPPAYTRTIPVHVPGLDSVDAQILLEIGKLFIEAGGDCILSKSELLGATNNLGLNADQIDESLEMLEAGYYIEGVHALGGKFVGIKLLNSGATIVLSHSLPNFDENCTRIAAYVVNNQNSWNSEISEGLALPLVLVNHVLDELNERGLIKLSHSLAGQRGVYDVSTQLRRSLR